VTGHALGYQVFAVKKFVFSSRGKCTHAKLHEQRYGTRPLNILFVGRLSAV
jgi:hypothetical protein